MKQLERHLGVSYPTARLRFDALLNHLGLSETVPARSRLEILEALARGDLDVEQAQQQLTALPE
jgi:hypothetical protein